MSPKPASQPAVWSNSVGQLFLQQVAAVAEADIRKLIHDPVELLTRMVQPVLWLTIFGQVFARTRAIPTGGVPYLDFMAPGILGSVSVHRFFRLFHSLRLALLNRASASWVLDRS